METVSCNLCGSERARPFAQLRDWLLERDDVSATLVECTRCGLVYQNPRPTAEEIGRHYPDEYESYNYDAGKRSWLVQKAYRHGITKRMRAITRHKRSGRLLDIGCASGIFLDSMRQTGYWQTCGVEISSYAAQIARERYGLEVFNGTLEQAGYADSAFDVVTMWDVFEHLHDPAATLDEIYRILKPDGLLIFRIPNLDSWDARLFGRYWAGLDAPRHLYVFGRSSVQRMLQAHRLRLQSLRCNIGSYPTFVISVRFWMTARGWPQRRRQTVERILYHPVMRVATAPLFWLLSRGGRGPLLIVTASKT